MTDSPNLYYTEPRNLRKPNYDEHFCLVYNKQGDYVGALYMNRKMRKVWRANGFGVTIIDI